MRYFARLSSKLGLACVLCLMSCAACNIIMSKPVQAEHSVPQNFYEKVAAGWTGYYLGGNPRCTPEYWGNNIGTLWLTDDLSNRYGWDYNGKMNKIEVEYGESFKKLWIVGTTYGCGGGYRYYENATSVKEENTHYLNGLSSDKLDRGGRPSDWHFSEPRGFIETSIDINRTGLGNEGGAQKQITVTIHRCYGNKGTCANTDVPIMLIRKPANWNIATYASVKEAGQKKYPGDTIHWRHRAENQSLFNTVGSGDKRLEITSHWWNANNANAAWGNPQTGNEGKNFLSGNNGQWRAPKNNKCLDVSGGSTAWGANVQTWECNASMAQQWRYDMGRATYVNPHSNLCLDVENGVAADKTNVRIWDCNGSNAQKWYPNLFDRTIRWSSYDSNWCLDRYGNSYNDGNNIILYHCNGTEAQKWYRESGAMYRQFDSEYTLTQDDVHKWVCRRTAASPVSNNNSGWVDSNEACVYVGYDYTPPPTPNGDNSAVYITTDHNGTSDEILVGSKFKFNYTIRHAGGRTKTMPIQAKAYTFVLRGGQGTSLAGPKTYPGNYFGNNVSCKMLSGPNGSHRDIDLSKLKYCAQDITELNRSDIVLYPSQNDSKGWKSKYSYSYEASVDPSGLNWERYAAPGDQICSYVAVNNWAAKADVAENSVRASNISCIRIARAPQMKIMGGDSRAAQFTAHSYASNSNVDKQRGSWSQYGLLSKSKPVENFGSDGLTTTNDFAKACRLIYANTNGGLSSSCDYVGTFDRSGSTLGLPAVDPSKKVGDPGSTVDLSTLRDGLYVHNGDVTVRGRLNQGVHATVYVTGGNITIDGNLTYGTYGELSQMPSLMLYAKDGSITVNPNVGQIDGILIAKSVDTCDISRDGGSMFNNSLGMKGSLPGRDKCSNQLRINGSIIVSDTGYSMKLHRTFGSGGVLGGGEGDYNGLTAPSEIINLSPNTFLTTFAGNNNKNKTYRITEVRSLPARY